MKKNIAWLVVSCLMALSLVIASCAPAVVEEEEKVTEEKPTGEKPTGEEVVTPTVEKPKYGGMLRPAYWQESLADFDQITGSGGGTSVTQHLTNETLWAGDWTKGKAGGYGTGETDWTAKADVWEQYSGWLAESWELPTKMEGDTATFIFHIRKGVHWALNPASEASRLVGGREMTVDDVISTLMTQITRKGAYLYKGNPELRVAQITSPAPWTVKIEVPWEAFETAGSRFGGHTRIVPPEVVAKYGDMHDWKVSVGTGPFMLTDLVPGTSATLMRNPNYWMKDPIGPGKGNQLPYVDGVKWIIISDVSTQYAALRTGKVDWINGMRWEITWEDAQSMLLKNTPWLMTAPLSTGRADNGILFKRDRPPFNDIRVRRAMMLAIDFKSIKNDYYGGDAQIQTWPLTYQKGYESAYLSLDDPECPESVKELYSYNPEKAKQLLAEAGYPQGFKTNMVLLNTNANIDYMSLYVNYWSKVGIDCELRPQSDSVLETFKYQKSFDQMLADSTSNTWQLYQMRYYWGPGVDNYSEINDPVVNEVQPKVQLAAVEDRAEANRMLKEMYKYLLDQAYAIPTVTPTTYMVWSPWVKNYSGELNVSLQAVNWPMFVWLDQELKASMGY